MRVISLKGKEESVHVSTESKRNIRAWKRGIPLYIMIFPGLLYFLIFKYIPMGGVIIAFQQFDPFDGFLKSDWVGLDNFRRLFGEQDFVRLLQNTLLLSCMNLILFFPAPIVLALLLNEARHAWFRKFVQTVVYVPHFLSWVIVVSLTILLFSMQEGGVNKLLVNWGFAPIELLTDSDYFRFLYVSQSIWKEAGWSAVIFFAALASIDPTLYEAAVVDGASRWRQIWHITLPGLRTTIIILFILRVGYLMDTSFEHILLMQNPTNLQLSDVFDTYVYRIGILQGDFSYTTTVGLFKSLIGLSLILIVNRVAKKIGEEGVY
ncbi:ABC transporter permease [Paenibacillus radicis (ex Xue et al. 2023)]|uniref:ABC transporter permease subunit n=1 Tax=Paenibacillus radicis (ex Xue et al. 2023) TaxID=2972489 RepID=A0ABT1YIQ1_9BACL|nr:ABC transporter permease subunit [Paenibacillus radicis (ex Xue et al. 2023)]MCR8633062.1 ABC transporter permease subunit [Paenibacillus radicis (ex Xue et al. 2023)]